MIVIPSEARNLQSAREDKTQIPRFTRDDKLLRVSGTASPLTNRAKTSLYLLSMLSRRDWVKTPK